MPLDQSEPGQGEGEAGRAATAAPPGPVKSAAPHGSATPDRAAGLQAHPDGPPAVGDHSVAEDLATEAKESPAPDGSATPDRAAGVHAHPDGPPPVGDHQPAGDLAAEPVEAMEAAETMETSDPTEPTDPTDPVEPATAAEPTEAVEAVEPTEPVGPATIAVPEAPDAAPLQGRVFLVGAGPGDPGLLTVRGREVLAAAAVVVYDRLVDTALLEHCPTECERIFAGKAPGRQTLSQADINRTLVERAARGLQVVRLKGGDPFVFGRGGEEALALTATGVPFEIVPGVTSAVAVAAYAGIPLTHRDVAASFAVVTGHERPGRATAAVDWSLYGQAPDTLVVLMGLAELPTIAAALVTAGRPAGTPVAAISQGTTPRQRTVVSTLDRIAGAVEAAGLTSPTALVVGEVVRLRAQLGWFERRPLFGRRIVVTRMREQASDLAAMLRAAGAEPLELPVLRIREVPNPSDLQWCVTNVASFWWICFTSAHAVHPFFGALRDRGLDARTLAGTRIACVGPATAHAVAAYGITSDVVPSRATAADLVEALRGQVYAGQKVLYIRGEPASDTLLTGLTQLGLEVRQTIVYKAVADETAAAAAAELLTKGADAVTFASSATIGHFLDAAGEAGRQLCAASKVVCIGPVTASAAEALGLRVDAVAAQATTAGMRDALIHLWAEPGGGESGG